MNTERIAKLRKGLNNSHISEDLKAKIRLEIEKLEKLDKKEPPVPKQKKSKPVFKVGDIVANIKSKTVGIVRDILDHGDIRTDADGVVNADYLERYSETKHKDFHIADSTKKEIGHPKKETVFSLAKQIRTQNEPWPDARKRAEKMMKDNADAKTETKDTEMRKLLKKVRGRKALRTIGRTNIARDSQRTAQPPGKRKSADGNVYYERRANRSDRNAPDYAGNAPKLKKGGAADATHVVVAETKNGYWVVMASPTSKSKSESLKKLITAPKGETLKVVTLKEARNHKHVLGTKYLYFGGVTIDYTGQVGETGAMSDGELFEGGGPMANDALSGEITQHYANYYLNEGAVNAMHSGGDLKSHGLKPGDTIVKTMSGGVQKIKDKDGQTMYVNLASGYRDYVAPLPFKKGGGVTTERKFVNKAEDYETRYASNRPNRKGYKGKRYADKKLFGGFSSKKSEIVGKQMPTTDDRYVHVLAYDDGKKQVQVKDLDKQGSDPIWIDASLLVLPKGMKLADGGKIETTPMAATPKVMQRKGNMARANALAAQIRKPGQTHGEAMKDAWKIIKSEQ